LYIQEIGRQMESDREERRHRQESNCAVTFGCGSVESEFYSKHGREPYEILRKRSIGFVFLSYNFTFFFAFLTPTYSLGCRLNQLINIITEYFVLNE
jgi:hypothetical protein